VIMLVLQLLVGIPPIVFLSLGSFPPIDPPIDLDSLNL